MIVIPDSVGMAAHEALGSPEGEYSSLWPCDALMSFLHRGVRLSFVISLITSPTPGMAFRCVERMGANGFVETQAELGPAIAKAILESDRFYLDGEDD